MLCPAVCGSLALSVTEVVCTTDLLYALFSDNTSQDTFPAPVLYNDDVHSCRHSRVWMLHNTYALWYWNILAGFLHMFCVTATFLLRTCSKKSIIPDKECQNCPDFTAVICLFLFMVFQKLKQFLCMKKFFCFFRGK